MGALILLLSSFLCFLMVDVAVDPLEDLYTSTDPDAATLIQERIEQLNLDRSSVERYFIWAGDFITGDPGTSWLTGRPVAEELRGAVIGTIQLVTAATFLSIFLGIGVGIVSALRQYTGFDYLVVFFSFVLYSLPVFWVAVLLKPWGAIGFNDFLADPLLSPVTIIVVAVLAGVLISMAIAGPLRRRLISIAGGTVAVAAMLFYLQNTGWWNEPHIGPELLLLNGVAAAFGITLLSTGLEPRRSLYSALTVVGLPPGLLRGAVRGGRRPGAGPAGEHALRRPGRGDPGRVADHPRPGCGDRGLRGARRAALRRAGLEPVGAHRRDRRGDHGCDGAAG